MALLAFVGVLLVRRYIATPRGRRRWDGWMLRLPGIGDLVTKVEFSRLSRTLGTLLHNGVSPLAALTIAQKTVGNAALRDAMETVVESVKEGKGLADPLARTSLVPDLAVQLTRVGEETARLDEMLLQIGEIYEQESKRSIDRLVALLVPAVTILLGVVVALVIGSVMSAILGVYDLAM
jgi:general secretion pathway protein F